MTKKKHKYPVQEMAEAVGMITESDGGVPAQGMQITSDVLSLDELKDFPDIHKEKPRNQAIMCAVACGYSTNFIAKMFDVSQPTVWEIIQRIDPNGMFKISPQAKKAFITKIAEARAMEALASITPEKLQECSAKEASDIASKLIGMSQNMNQSKHRELTKSRLDNLLGALEEAEVEVVE